MRKLQVSKNTKKETAFDKLSDKHKLFVKNYVHFFGNASKAYMATYPSARDTTARSKSPLLVAKDSIKQAIAEEYAEIYAKIQTETEKTKTYNLIKTLGDIEISDIIDLENGTLKVKDLKDIPPEALHAIQSIEYTEKDSEGENYSSTDKNLKVKLHPKLKALELRAKIQGLLDPDEGKKQMEITITPAVKPQKVVGKSWDDEK